MSVPSRIRTSKWLLALVVLSGPAAVIGGWEPDANQLAVYLASVAGVVFNRLDSRKQGYEATFSFGRSSISIKTGGDDESEKLNPEGGPGGADYADGGSGRVPGGRQIPKQ